MSKFPEAAAAVLLLGLAAGLVAGLAAAPAAAGPLGLGRQATPEEVAAWDIDVRPDGLGLPEGSGSVADGEAVYVERCAVCHGDFAEGVGRWPVLAGGFGTLASDNPVKTIGSYWPYLSTVWDYVHRAMPFGNAQSLSPDEVYAITAYLLYSNDLVDDDFVLGRENFTEVHLPNEANFFADDRSESPLFGPHEVCMQDCKAEVRITMRARVLDVTPEGAGVAETGEEALALAEEAVEEEGSLAEAAAEDAAEEVADAQPAIDAELAAAGETLFKRCQACHQVGESARNRVGPVLNGIYGAPLAQVEDFRYSKALLGKAEEGLVWDEATLGAFLESPRTWAKGTRMAFPGLRKEPERVAVIEYLKSVSQ